MSASSQTPRRSPRFAVKAETPVAVPAAPKKARAPKKPSAAAAERWRQLVEQVEADEEAAGRLIDSRIKTAVADAALLECLDQQEDFRGTLTYLFETLFASDNFYSLGAHHAYTDAIFRIVQRIHSGEIEQSNSELFVRGFNCICLFLYECGFPTSEFFRK
jgi:hypothetical protein